MQLIGALFDNILSHIFFMTLILSLYTEGQLKDKVRFRGEPSLRAVAFRNRAASLTFIHIDWPWKRAL